MVGFEYQHTVALKRLKELVYNKMYAVCEIESGGQASAVSTDNKKILIWEKGQFRISGVYGNGEV